MIDPNCTPIAHHSPRPPIDLRPVYQPDPQSLGDAYLDAMAYAARLIEGQRMWAAVVEFAQGRGAIPWPDAQKQPASSNGMPIADSAVARGSVSGDGAIRQPEDETPTSGHGNAIGGLLEDGRNSKDTAPCDLPGYQFACDRGEIVGAWAPPITWHRVGKPRVFEYDASGDVWSEVRAFDGTLLEAGPPAVHCPACGYHADQYPWECDCGGAKGGGE